MLALAAALLLADADPVVIPPTLRTMIDAALKSGNEQDIATIVKYARVVDPASADAVAQLALRWHADKDAERIAKLRQASFIDLWKGKIEVDGSRTTGNSDTAGVTGSLDLERDGLHARQKIHALADWQESLGITTRDHLLGSYEYNYKVSDRLYYYGQAQYERDRFSGYYNRESGSVGFGYSVVKRPGMTLDLELGPAYRQTSFTNNLDENGVATRGSMDFKWKLTPTLSFEQTGSGYLESFNSTVTGTTSFTAKLFGPLSAQFSYNVQYESHPPAPSLNTDTTSRAGLVYAF